MDINNIGGSLNIVQAGGARRVEVKVPTEVQLAPVPQQPQPQVTEVKSDTARVESLRAAASAAVRNLFAVSDTTFSIFKDASGQYITRVRSLRDGTVRTFPEYSMYEFVRSQKAASSFDTEA